MPAEQEQSNFEIVPPIILNEDADVQAYPSVEAVIRHVEVIDISNEEYEFHDSTGRVLEARLRKGKVILVPTAKLEPDSAILRARILRVLALQGVPEGGLSFLSFNELSRLLLEKFEKRK